MHSRVPSIGSVALMDETVVLPIVAVPPPSPQPTVLAAQGVGVRRGTGWALRQLTADIPAGCLVALSGPIGSGHTRALLALSGRHRLDEGTVEVVDGLATIGWLPDLAMLDEALTVEQNMTECVLALDADPDKIDDALAWASLLSRKRAPASVLTCEERVLLGLAWSSLTDTSVVAIEATCVMSSGSPVWQAARDLAERGRTVLVGTALAVPPAEITIQIPWEISS